MSEACVGKLCGRPLSAADLEAIRRAILEADPPLRAEVARRVCDALGWHDALGRPKFRHPDPVTKNQQDTSAAENLS